MVANEKVCKVVFIFSCMSHTHIGHAFFAKVFKNWHSSDSSHNIFKSPMLILIFKFGITCAKTIAVWYQLLLLDPPLNHGDSLHEHHISRLNPKLMVTSNWYSTILCHGEKVNIYIETYAWVIWEYGLITDNYWANIHRALSLKTKHSILHKCFYIACMHQKICKSAFVSGIVWCQSTMWRE